MKSGRQEIFPGTQKEKGRAKTLKRDAHKLDIASVGGEKRTACIFVHGLGMNKSIWTAPEEARVMGGLFPFTVMLRKKDRPLKTLFHDLGDLGFTVIAWSQSRPVGPIEEAIKELKRVIDFARREYAPSGILLIGHSRGGLIARKYMEGAASPLKAGIKGPVALVTLSAPHHGSDMARWALYLSPLASLLKPLIPEAQRGTLSKALRKIVGFFESRGVRELLPDSEFIRSLRSTPPEGDNNRGIYASAGGTDPRLVKIAGSIALPEALEKIIPEKFRPEEMTAGKGDGLVSLRSSVLPYADEHFSFPVNHAEMLVEPEARRAIVDRVKALP
jgi:pimeloyl-ACP methyl ester carboxylesterase